MRIKHTTKNTVLSIMLSLALLVTLTPSIAFTPAYAADAGTSEYYLEKMQEYQAQIDEYQPIYDQAVADEEAALETVNSTKATMESYKETIETAEPAINEKTREFIDNQTRQAWARDIATFKRKNPTSYNTLNEYANGNYDVVGLRAFLIDEKLNLWYAYLKNNPNNNRPEVKRMKAIEDKYGEGALRDAVYHTLSYDNVMRSLDFIDECNEIRANASELANYWQGVRGKSTPSGIKQLKVSPYLMSVSAMSVTLNLNDSLNHVYGIACISGYMESVPWYYAGGQNIYSARGASRIGDPFSGWWYRENGAGQDAHNGNIASPQFTQCGFGTEYHSDTMNAGACSQDFIGVDESLYPGISVASYRNGLKSYCGSILTAFEEAKANYDSSVTAYNNALKAYNTAKLTTYSAASKLNTAKSNYNWAKGAYNACINAENNAPTYTVKFKDSVTGEIIETVTVKRGGSCNYPTPPVHEGYTFTGWSMEPVNIQYNTIVSAYYSKDSNSGGTTPTTPTEPNPGDNPGQTQTYTVTFIRSFDASILDEIEVNAGDTLYLTSKSLMQDKGENNINGYRFNKWYAFNSQLKNIQSDLIIAGAYYKIGDNTYTTVWDERIIVPARNGPVTLREINNTTPPPVGGSNGGSSGTDVGSTPGTNNPGSNTGNTNPGEVSKTPAKVKPTNPAKATPKKAAPKTKEIVDLPAVKISKPKAGKKSMTVKWKKVSKKNQKKIGSIQVRYSTSKNFDPAVTKVKTVKKTKKSLKVKKLQPKKTYYVQVRAYKKVNGVVHVSKWSARKAIKIK